MRQPIHGSANPDFKSSSLNCSSFVRCIGRRCSCNLGFVHTSGKFSNWGRFSQRKVHREQSIAIALRLEDCYSNIALTAIITVVLHNLPLHQCALTVQPIQGRRLGWVMLHHGRHWTLVIGARSRSLSFNFFVCLTYLIEKLHFRFPLTK